MKQLIRFFAIILLLIAAPLCFVLSSVGLLRSLTHKPFYYAASLTRYAKIGKDCYFFKSQNVFDVSIANVFYILPETYFVSIIDDSMSPAIKVRYSNTIGYVNADSIKEVNFVPLVLEPNNISFDMGAYSGTQLMSAPSMSAAQQCVIGKNVRGIKYVASTLGEVPPGGVSNIWYYAVYIPAYDPTSVFEGYVYSERTVNLSEIAINEEGLERPAVSDDPEDELDEEDANFAMNNTVKIVLIVMICLPIILVFVLLLISNKKGKNQNLEKQLEEGLSSSNAEGSPPKKKSRTATKKSAKPKIRNLDDLSGQTLVRKPVFYTNFLDAQPSKATADLKPEFPTYEVVDDDELL